MFNFSRTMGNETGKSLKAWELLRHWQKGSKLTHRTFPEGMWLELTSDIHGNIDLTTENGFGNSLIDYLEMEEDDGWFVFEEGKWQLNNGNYMDAWELLKHLQEGKKMRHSEMAENDWIAITCDIFGHLAVINESGETLFIHDVLDIKDERDWHVAGEIERFASLECVEEQLLMLTFDIDGKLKSKTRTQFEFELKDEPNGGKVVFQPVAEASLYVGGKMIASKKLTKQKRKWHVLSGYTNKQKNEKKTSVSM